MQCFYCRFRFYFPWGIKLKIFRVVYNLSISARFQKIIICKKKRIFFFSSLHWRNVNNLSHLRLQIFFSKNIVSEIQIFKNFFKRSALWCYGPQYCNTGIPLLPPKWQPCRQISKNKLLCTILIFKDFVIRPFFFFWMLRTFYTLVLKGG